MRFHTPYMNINNIYSQRALLLHYKILIDCGVSVRSKSGKPAQYIHRHLAFYSINFFNTFFFHALLAKVRARTRRIMKFYER